MNATTGLRSVVQVLPWAGLLLGVAGLFYGLGLFYSLAGRIDAPRYVREFRRLLDAGNRQRAIRIASITPHYALCTLALAALTLRLPLADPSAAAPGSDRDATPERSFRDRALDRLEALRAAQEARLRRPVALAFGGAALAVASAIALVALAPAQRAVANAVGGVAAALALYALVAQRRAARGLALAVQELVSYVLAEDGETMPLREGGTLDED